MTTLDYIKHKFSYIGAITDDGATDFAIDFGIEIKDDLTDTDKTAISGAVDGYIHNNILHPTSINENGFSVTWSANALANFVKMALKKYGIDPNEETSALVGLSVIKDASELW